MFIGLVAFCQDPAERVAVAVVLFTPLSGQSIREWLIANVIDYRAWSFGRVSTVQRVGLLIYGHLPMGCLTPSM
jgi:hypothetical protein